MAEVRTIADPRVVDESGVVMNQYVGPLNWEHYKIPASGLSDSQITFANLVTLGTNRIYDSNFQVEYTIQVDLTDTMLAAHVSDGKYSTHDVGRLLKFNPFPLHWVTDQLRINVNGSACMSRPQESLLQRMMYWRQNVLDKTCSFCPHTKAPMFGEYMKSFLTPEMENRMRLNSQKYDRSVGKEYDTELPCVRFHYNIDTHIAEITFREPVLCPPFNQRLDKIYQRPIFNVTSIDIVYQLNDIRKMLLPLGITAFSDASHGVEVLTSYLMTLNEIHAHLTSAQLCFNVASMPPGMTVPPSMTMPYYDNVCYVTQAQAPRPSESFEITSGVYTLAQVPTAIYIFAGANQMARGTILPTIREPEGSTTYPNTLTESFFCPIKHINITMGNNTQLLNTTSEYDRYQMCIANGLEDCSWEEFSRPYLESPATWYWNGTARGTMTPYGSGGVPFYGAGGHGNRCCLRLIPGIDLLIPDRRLVGGMDADQMVFQVKMTIDTSGIPYSYLPYLSLWIMFEYCGVLTIEPVHASIDMIPIKSMPPLTQIDAVADATADEASGGGEGTANPAGAGIFDGIKRFFTKIPSYIASIPQKILDFARTPSWARDAAFGALGFGVPQRESQPINYKDLARLGFTPNNTTPGLLDWMPPDKRAATDSTAPSAPPAPVGGTIIGKGKLGKFYV